MKIDELVYRETLTLGMTKEELEGLRSVPVQRARKINYHKTGACCLNIITYCCDAKYSRK